MRHWTEDPDCRDQYSVIYEAGERTAIFNNDAKEPIVSEERAVRLNHTSKCSIHGEPIKLKSTVVLCLETDDVFVSRCSAGQRRMCAGLPKERTWQPSTNVALHCGAARSSSRFRGSAIRACPWSTSHHVRGNQYCCLALLIESLLAVVITWWSAFTVCL